MKIFLMYYDRYEEATTSKFLDIDHYVLCHDSQERFTCVGDKGKLLQTDQPKGIQNNFNYGLSMLEDGEWGIFMSDDCVGAKKLEKGKFIDCSVMESLNELIGIIPKADEIGVKLIGLNSTGNPMYARNKYSKFGLVDGRCFAIKKTSFTYHPVINTIPDYYATVYHLNKYGGNLILNYTYIDFKRYEKGGLGSEQDRIDDKLRDVDIMLTRFPKNVQLKDKPGQPKNSHIIIKKAAQNKTKKSK
jgi:hypothetical protein